jgi:glycosyltransferase domain-containing protein
MPVEPQLTVILTLRGRHLHTLRWMWHANRVKFPFHIVIADGEVHPAIDRVLSDAGNFPNISYEYHRHCDVTFTDFFRKCAETARKVKTKYVMMSDNDDFLVVAGILRSIAHLEREPDYVCAGGEIPNFTVVPEAGDPRNLVGAMAGLTFGYAQGVHDIAFASASERVMDVLNRYHVTYYHAFRTAALQLIFEEAEAHDFSDLSVHELFCAARTVTLGKVKSDPSVVSYVRQTGTSMLSTYYKDWVHHLLRSNLPRDYREMASAIALEVARMEGTNADEFRELVLDAHAAHLRHMLAHTMMRYRFPRLFRLKRRLSWTRELRIVPHRFREHLRTKQFWAALSRDCPDKALLSQYHAGFAEIAISLQGDAFLSFVRSRAPELQ